ncbi:Aste57867_23272 [Aphanomyces stellatus]|uniref:Aste57867_23272 protein n=1 Tax=Aphanomyces stellatus TaxID=120398 RepID=A0A485LMD3_9STRA|nr:hypothetical protein As57867_023201 [Aphanomyces stellatus]VFT99917.1 Aste57867_23272 [Aphanomyces stellatus]
MDQPTTTAAPSTGPESNSTGLIVGSILGGVALICLVVIFCRRRKHSVARRRQNEGHKPWDTITPVMSADDAGMTIMEEGGKESYVSVSEPLGKWQLRPSNILSDNIDVPPMEKVMQTNKSDIVLLEDDELMFIQSHRKMAVPQATIVVPARQRLGTEDDDESGDIVDEEFSARSTNSFANEMDGGWNTNLSLVSEMSMLDSEHGGDRMSTLSFSSLDDDYDVTEAKI